MPQDTATNQSSLVHGLRDLPAVTVDSYGEELRDRDGIIGDHANKRALGEALEGWREQLRRKGDDPFGDTPTEDISKKTLDKVLAEGDPEAAGIIHGALEQFAQQLSSVARSFLKLKSWHGTERLAIGGGLRDSRIGEIAIGRAAVLLKSEGLDIDLVPIHDHPDEAGLIGAVHLLPSWMLSGHDAMLAVDIGGTNIRAGIVGFGPRKHPDLAKAEVIRKKLWCHREDKPTRDAAVERLVEMLTSLVKSAEREKLALVPLIGVGCPGIINEDGSIDRGGQNLPGNWEHKKFSLPQRLSSAVTRADGQPHTVLMHNDAVVQGLSELPHMQDVEHWGIFTIGTGLGNCRFTNKRSPK